MSAIPKLCLAIGLLQAVAAPEVAAQYFGQNKVHYQTFDFKVLKSEHFDIHYYPAERDATLIAARMAERWRSRLTQFLAHDLTGRQPLILYAGGPQFRETNVISGDIGEGTGGVTEALRRRVVLPFAGPLRETDHVIGHELVHAFQYQITSKAGLSIERIPGAAALPLWFIEGMAEYLSLGPADPHTAMWLRDAATRKLPTIGDLESSRFFPYRYGEALVAYIAGRFGDAALRNLLLTAAKRRDIRRAIPEVLHVTPEQLAADWHQEIRAASAAVAARTDSAARYGRRLVRVRDEPGSYDVGPALSPDGRWIIFLSDRDLFSIDLFLADGTTGKVVRRITETALDPHLQSLEFISSAGAWDPAGRRFAFAGVKGSRPVLAIYDVEQERVVRELKLEHLDEAYSPSWSPKGDAIVFSGLKGGLLDLFIYDLTKGSLRQLTSDAFADLQPAWSPDGRSIAFATDRFTSSLTTLDFGPPKLALCDVASGAIRRLGVQAGKQINPQWGSDGRSLFYVSDASGIANVYRFDVGSGSTAPVTNLYTGVSGITALSPALSVAQTSGALVFSAFENQGFTLYRIDTPRPLGGALPTATVELPPSVRRDSVAAVLADATTGLPSGSSFPVTEYKSRLSLEYVTPPTLVGSFDQFGTHVGGGVALVFGDLLENHNLITGFQVNGSLKDVFAVVGYQNLRRRFNWGVAAQQVPYLSGGYAQGFTTVNGQQVFAQQVLLERQTNREVGFNGAYPFSRAQRIEFSTAFTNISFDRELRTAYFDPNSGAFLGETVEQGQVPQPLNLAQLSTALVFDNALLGATSPVIGQRYRLEASPMLGSIQMVQGLADYRRYLLPVRPVTLAFRVLHFGRYGRDAEDTRLTPLFLGYESLVRGYGYRSFDPSECQAPPSAPNSCPVFDQLLGSRILVGNAELRFPLFGLLGIGHGYYGVLPLELAVFGDAGVAWHQGETPRVFGGDRPAVASAGLAARLNLFGFAVVQLDWVHPFDRPQRNWLWQVSLQPGF